MENRSGIGTLIVFLIALYVLVEFWQIILGVAIGTTALYIAYKKHQKKKEDAITNWIPNNVQHLEKVTRGFVERAARLQKGLIESNHYVENEPTSEKTTIYHTLDERAEYLNVAEERLFEVSNKILLAKFPYLRPIKNLIGLEQNIHHIQTMLHNFWRGYDRTPNSDKGKEIENQLFLKNGLDMDYLNQTRTYRTEEFLNFIRSLTNFDESYNPIVIEKKIIHSGLAGERRLQDEIDLYSDVLTALYNVRLEVEGNSVESDAIVVSPKGVFTVEAKNFSSSGSYSIRVTKDGQWQKVWPNGRTEPMKDVVGQTNRHVAFKQRFINQVLRDKGFGVEYINVKSIIVIANDNVMIENESDTPIIRLSQIYNYIQKQPNVLSTELVTIITDLLQENTLEAKRFPHRSYEKEMEQWLNFILPTIEYAYHAGLAHKAFIDEIGKQSGENRSEIFLHGYEELEYPPNVELEDIRRNEQQLVS
ncbi:nuclease-related domain-containing protein [Fictibacillus phosphorivorans]|uniref:nuclease-related domain-containing protein n=1 Tax=Fictibacillus phosphorivorans TaxID=1221500 RepID=UPI003CF27E9C